jgi:hypothetical protein
MLVVAAALALLALVGGALTVVAERWLSASHVVSIVPSSRPQGLCGAEGSGSGVPETVEGRGGPRMRGLAFTC